MRSDAVKRRRAIVEAARELFAAQGGGVALDSVAEAAGVGVGTLYRNFPSRAALADEVALAILDDLRQATTEALRDIGQEPEAAWEALVQRMVDLDLGALTAALAEILVDGLSEQVKDAQRQALGALDRVIGAARSARLVRGDLGALELVIAVGMITRPQPAAVHAAAPGLVPHLVSILLRGMRPGGPGAGVSPAG